MILIAGSVTIKPEHRAEAIERAMRIAADSEAEDGCISYRFSVDLEDANRFLLFEEWASEEALERHFLTAHLQEFQRHLPRLVAGEFTIRRYRATAI